MSNNHYHELLNKIENVDCDVARKHYYLVNKIRELLTEIRELLAEVQELTVRVRRLEKEVRGE